MIYQKREQRSRFRGDERGITMLEVTLLLGALAIASAAVAPALLRTLNSFNAKNVVAEMEALHVAMIGDTVTGTYGYVGDHGRFPYVMDELVLQLDQPFFVRSETSGVGYGWNGPYVVRGNNANDFRLDPWGNEYDVGVVGTGQLRSAGPNGIYDDDDDMVYPPYPVDPYGSLLVTVKGHSGDSITNDPDGCIVTMEYSDSGQINSVFDDVAPFSFEFVHRGLHAVAVSCTSFSGVLVTETGVASVRGGGAQQAMELHVELGEELAGASAEPESASQSDAASDGAQG